MDEHDDIPSWGVVAEPDSPLNWFETSAETFRWDHREGRRQQLIEWLERGVDPVIVDGDDRWVSTVFTAYRRQRTPSEPERRFCPLETDGFATIARSVDGPARESDLPERLEARIERRRLEEITRPSLRVTPSTEPASQYGFSFGAGALFALFELRYRAGEEGAGWRRTLGEWARELISSRGESRFQPETGRVSVDYEPWGESIGFMLASGLDETWFGWSLRGEGARWQGGSSGRDFVQAAARARTLPSLIRSDSSDTFHRLHLDWSAGYVLDGELYDPDVPYVLQVAPGPTARFVR